MESADTEFPEINTISVQHLSDFERFNRPFAVFQKSL